MCVPPIALAAAAAVVGMVGQFAQGKSAQAQANYQAAVATSNQHLSEEQAKNEIDRTQKAAAARQRQASQLEGTQQAAMAANGIDLNFGSAVDVMKDSKMIAAEDTGNIYAQGFQNTRGYLIDAYNSRVGAIAARTQAKAAMTSAYIGMAGTALGGASQISRMSAAKKATGSSYSFG